MIIRKFNCENLGGINKQELEFAPGLNVLFGPNEAGKSTVVEGILAALFRSHRKKNTAADRDFDEKFRPYPYGDSMKCQLIFTEAGQEYILDKEWGSSPAIGLTLQGQTIKDEKILGEKLRELFRFGEKTYSNVVFARQGELRAALDRLRADEDTGGALGDILRKAVMAMDGVSVERLKKRIEEEYISLQGHWDIENNRPEKGRGLEDPWRTGKGLVLDSYYRKEELLYRIKKARQLEDEYSAAAEKLRQVTEHRREVRVLRDKYAAMEDDITRRCLLENEIDILEKEILELKEIIQQKPAKEAELANYNRERERLLCENKSLRSELQAAQRIQNAKSAQELLERVNKLKGEIAQKKLNLKEYPLIEESQLKRLEELYNRLSATKAALQAATLQAVLKKSPQPVYVTRGLKEKERIQPGCDFSASGFFRLETEDGLELEVRAGQIDFDNLKREFMQNKEEYAEILRLLQVSDLIEAKNSAALSGKLARELQFLETQLRELERGRDMAAIQREVQETVALTARQQEELQALLTINEEAMQKVGLQAALLRNTLEGWVKLYGDLEQLLDNFALRSGRLEEKKKELAGLAPLPAEFSAAAAFREELTRLRRLDDNLAEEEKLAQKHCFEKERQLPDVTWEELQGLYTQAESEHRHWLQRLKKIAEIREVIYQKSAEMDQDSYRPLIEAFSKYLAKLTLNRYTLGEVNETLEVKITRQDMLQMPSHLFSAGTYDSVLLALRLALLETLFPEGEGLLVLDDCLVNLDPLRKEQAALVLREFADRYQVIFTTCDPLTAELLGGNIINLEGKAGKVT